MKRFILLLFGLAVFAGCDKDSAGPGPVQTSYTFSFEKDAQNWIARGMDLELGDSTIHWSVARSADRARDGGYSMKLSLDNMNDAGKIWMQRAFTLEPNRTYAVTVTYAFATSDFGDLNQFTIIAGASHQDPADGKSLVFQGTTANGADSEKYVWLEKKYTFTAESGDTGVIYVFLGVWGTWETLRTYYIDNVRVVFQAEENV